jgi:hypothetical protein
MWRKFQGAVQKADELFPPIVVDAALVMFATAIITALVRSIV